MAACMEEHLVQVQTTLQRLHEAELMAKPQKCKFGLVVLPGHIVEQWH